MRIEQIAPLFGVLRFYITDDHNVMWYGGDIAKMLGFKNCTDAIKRHTINAQRELKQRPGYPHQLAYYLNYDGFKAMCKGVRRRENKDRADGVLVNLDDFQEEARREWYKIPKLPLRDDLPYIKIQKVSEDSFIYSRDGKEDDLKETAIAGVIAIAKTCNTNFEQTEFLCDVIKALTRWNMGLYVPNFFTEMRK
ncbi:hypothetical protein [Acidaminococcus massiliensis]|jgi:hypothetical protein|uniref:hypothetical protein n=1 Tax=Acidaminococcus massiliensis TaxID=1852375 RepID=UPI00206AEE72|nr:hypothetical protein [Acidaminococcus massiliensis]DAR24875.1 MAG TPA: hypothetical protein [Caudoviricetes sp.]